MLIIMMFDVHIDTERISPLIYLINTSNEVIYHYYNNLLCRKTASQSLEHGPR